MYTLMSRMCAFISKQEQFSSDQSHDFCNSSKFLITPLRQSTRTVRRVWQNNFMVGYLSPSKSSASSLLPLELFSTSMKCSLASRLGDIFTSFVSLQVLSIVSLRTGCLLQQDWLNLRSNEYIIHVPLPFCFVQRPQILNQT